MQSLLESFFFINMLGDWQRISLLEQLLWWQRSINVCLVLTFGMEYNGPHIHGLACQSIKKICEQRNKWHRCGGVGIASRCRFLRMRPNRELIRTMFEIERCNHQHRVELLLLVFGKYGEHFFFGWAGTIVFMVCRYFASVKNDCVCVRCMRSAVVESFAKICVNIHICDLTLSDKANYWCSFFCATCLDRM